MSGSLFQNVFISKASTKGDLKKKKNVKREYSVLGLEL